MSESKVNRVAASEILAATRGLTKQYPGTTALDSVDFDIRAGEVHALLGQNGAGKSTLIKILSGAVEPTSGSVTVLDHEVHAFSPERMRALGIATIYQELTLIPGLTIAENLSLSREPIKAKIVLDRKSMRVRAEAALRKFGLELHADQLAGELSIGEQQLIEIAKAMEGDARVLILDEPTAALTRTESERLFTFIHRLRESGVGLIYISHRLDEVEALADRITVLRNGHISAEFASGECTRADLIAAMLGGAAITQASGKLDGRHIGDSPVLEARGLATEHIDSFNLSLYSGEVLGLAGLLGSGRTEMMRALFGADPSTRGDLLRQGVSAGRMNPSKSWASGIGFAPEDRKSQGLFLHRDLAENIAMAAPPARRGGFLKRGELTRRAKDIISLLGIRSTSERAHADSLSGGNQQKLVLGRALFADASILLIDEPTRGVDVGAKAEIWSELRRLASEGRSVCVISSELEEMVGNVDRVVVIREHQIVGELSGDDITQAALFHAVEGDIPSNQSGPGGGI